MSEQNTKLIILGVYLLGMLIVGFLTMKKTKNFSDYVLGGRKLGKWTTALSAQASDMSGWLLLGLPGAIYLSGMVEAWVAIGLAIGTYLNWRIVAKRLRVYTESAGNSLTIPDFLENRFADKTRVLRTVPALVIIFFFAIYTSSQFAAGAKLFSAMLNIDYQKALIVGSLVIIGYTLLGGFLAVSFTDVIQGVLMFIALIIVPIYAIVTLGGWDVIAGSANAVDANFLSMFKSAGGKGISVIAILSGLAWGLGYCGQPHILARFMAIEKPDHLKASRIIACIWVAITLVAAVVVGIVGRTYFKAVLSDPERVFMYMVDGMFPAILGGIFLAAILAASMSTADSQLLVTTSSIAEDIYKPMFKKDISDSQLLVVSRVSLAIVSIIAVVIAWNPNSSVFNLVSYAWAGLGAAFGPVVLISLFWKRMNGTGAISGMVSGALTVIIWNALESRFPQVSIFGLYELLPAFIISIICIFAISMLTKEPEQDILDTFDEVQEKLKA